MAGGGGDAPPLPSSNGGEFLLSLLQKAPHHHFQQPRPPPPPPHPQQPSPVLDPAVAAVGPTLPFNGRDHPTNNPSSSSSPHHPNFLGFHQNLYHSPPQSNHFFQFGTTNPTQFQPNPNQLADNLRNIGFSTPNNIDSRQHQQHQLEQRQKLEDKLKFRYLPSDIIIRNSPSDIAKLSNGFDRTLQLNPHEQETRAMPSQNQNQSQSQNHRTMPPPPPGFGNKPLPRREQNVGWERQSSSRDAASFENERARRMAGEDGRVRGNGVSAQLDRPGPPAGTSLHSVSASEIEVSMMNLENGGRGRKDGVEDVGGQRSPGDEKDDKNEGKQHQKDSRSDNRGQNQLSQRMRNYKRQMQCRIDIDRFNTPFLVIFKSLIPTEEDKSKQKQVLTLLENIICKEWPEARLYIYGSCGNSFGVSKSDIDLCLAIGDADVNKAEVLLRLADLLELENLQNVQALTRARVPIVKLMDPVTGISCDICINNVLAVVNTKLLRDYAHIDARLRQLAFIVKHWAKSRGVNETYHGTLSSYAYVLMCIHFLQQRRPAILPCLQGMRATYSVNVENVECAFFDQVERLQDFGSHNKETIAELVWAFFNYWAYSHDYSNTVISVRRGSTISKREKDWTRRIGNDRHLICIEDPFETSHDLGRVVDKYSIKVLREEFERAAQIMQYDANPCVKLFEPYP